MEDIKTLLVTELVTYHILDKKLTLFPLSQFWHTLGDSYLKLSHNVYLYGMIYWPSYFPNFTNETLLLTSKRHITILVCFQREEVVSVSSHMPWASTTTTSTVIVSSLDIVISEKWIWTHFHRIWHTSSWLSSVSLDSLEAFPQTTTVIFTSLSSWAFHLGWSWTWSLLRG